MKIYNGEARIWFNHSNVDYWLYGSILTEKFIYINFGNLNLCWLLCGNVGYSFYMLKILRRIGIYFLCPLLNLYSLEKVLLIHRLAYITLFDVSGMKEIITAHSKARFVSKRKSTKSQLKQTRDFLEWCDKRKESLFLSCYLQRVRNISKHSTVQISNCQIPTVVWHFCQWWGYFRSGVSNLLGEKLFIKWLRGSLNWVFTANLNCLKWLSSNF